MPRPLIIAALRLADVLDRENAALAAMDISRATALLPEKIAAVTNLTAFGEATPEPPNPALIAVARRLDSLALANRRLLKRAIDAQQRVIGIVVRAAAAAAEQPFYAAPDGARRGTGGRSISPMALSTRV